MKMSSIIMNLFLFIATFLFQIPILYCRSIQNANVFKSADNTFSMANNVSASPFFASIFSTREKRAIMVDPYLPINGRGGWPIIESGDTGNQIRNDRIVFFQLVMEQIRSLNPNVPPTQMTMIGLRAKVNWGISMLQLMTCLAPTEKEAGNLQNFQYVAIHAKTSSFYKNNREAGRCATTYAYKWGETGLTLDAEEGAFYGLHQETRIRFMYYQMNVPGRMNIPSEVILPETMCCTMAGKFQHEFLHSIGFIHEHQRPDRHIYAFVFTPENDAVLGLTEDYLDMKVQRFRIVSGNTLANTFAQPYDYGSIMHFGPLPIQQNQKFYNFGHRNWGDDLLNDLRDGQADVLAINKLFQQTIGQTKMASFQDIKRLNLKHCLRRCGEMYHGKCMNGGYLNPSVYLLRQDNLNSDELDSANKKAGTEPKGCTKCLCPDGYGGEDCGRQSKNSNAKDNSVLATQVKLNELFGQKCNLATQLYVTDSTKQAGYRVTREPNSWPIVDSQQIPRGIIRFPPPPIPAESEYWRTINFEDDQARQDPISCYWSFTPKNAFEKVAVKLLDVNLPCMQPCHSYVEIKYKRDKTLTGARFCCPYSHEEYRRTGRKRKADGEFVETKETIENFPEIIADNGVPVMIIMRLNPDRDLIHAKHKFYRNYERPGFYLKFWVVTPDQELFYDLSYQTNKFHLPRNARGQLDPENPIREGLGYGASGAPYLFQHGGYVPDWRTVSGFPRQ